MPRDGYQNIDRNESTGLTEHQREYLRAHHQDGGWLVRLQRSMDTVTETCTNLLRGRHYSTVGTDIWSSNRARHVVFVATTLMLLLILITWLSGGKKGYHQQNQHNHKGQATEPQTLPSSQDHVCPPLPSPVAGKRYIQIHNRCDNLTIWVGGIGPNGGALLPPNDGSKEGWKWSPGSCRLLTVPSYYPSLRLWGRTGCVGTNSPGTFKCQSGNCVVNGDGGCVSAGEVATLFEATLQDTCSATPGGQHGPDFYDLSCVDGYNLPLSVKLIGGSDVPATPKTMSCVNPQVRPMSIDDCPYELRSYSDQLPGSSVPLTSLAGKNVETSPCYRTPSDPSCQQKFNGCRSLCKALDEGWLGFYIDNVQGPLEEVNPMVKLPTGKTIRWSQQFLQGKEECGLDGCRSQPAWGGYRGHAYSKDNGGAFMKNLVCCDGPFFCSPYQPNVGPGCSYTTSCPTLGAGDPASSFHSRFYMKDLDYPQSNQQIRFSSNLPDFPVSTFSSNYAAIYKESNPTAYSWQYDDGHDSLFLCCGVAGGKGPHYLLTFCDN